ncbi:MAG: hypothetical protein Q7T74_00675 [Candidatus Saccharibacteria bacterium]|nr:hypothetical protein [Candidatus Saccharibacteria bacterium]
MEDVITIQVGNRVIGYKNLYNDEINQGFENFYKTCFGGNLETLEKRLYIFWPTFFEIAQKYLSSQDEKFSIHDNFFENFTVVSEWLWENGFSEQAARVWASVSKFIKEFEKKYFQIHKGSLFYFWSIPLLMLERIDASILSLHKAVLEDKRNKPNEWRDNPAHQVLSLSDNPNPYLRNLLIDPVLVFISKRISLYNSRYSRNFSISELRTLFLDNPAIETETIYYFTLSIYKLTYIRRLSDLGLGQSTIGPLVLNSSIGSVLLIWENLLRQSYEGRYLRNLTASLMDDSGTAWGNSTVRTGKANDDANKNLVRCIKRRKDRNLRQDLLLGYVLRNNTFHSLESDDYLWQIHTDLIQIIFNCLFTALKPKK